MIDVRIKLTNKNSPDSFILKSKMNPAFRFQKNMAANPRDPPIWQDYNLAEMRLSEIVDLLTNSNTRPNGRTPDILKVAKGADKKRTRYFYFLVIGDELSGQRFYSRKTLNEELEETVQEVNWPEQYPDLEEYPVYDSESDMEVNMFYLVGDRTISDSNENVIVKVMRGSRPGTKLEDDSYRF